MPMRKREEVQKMLRRCLVAAALAACALAGAGDPLWDELGLKSSNTEDAGQYKVTTWRFKDATGAFAASLAMPGSRRVGNGVVSCEGKCPKELNVAVPNTRDGPLPTLRTYLPQKGLAPHSERYVLGPVGLSQSALQIPAAAANFQFGTEADVGRYSVGKAGSKNEATLAIFMYPMPQMARKQLPEFEKIPGALAKRSGPIIGVVLNAPDQKTANRLLSEIEYQASISWDKQPPLVIHPQTAGQIVMAGVQLTGIVLVFCTFSGLAFGAIRLLMRKFGNESASGVLTRLRLTDK